MNKVTSKDELRLFCSSHYRKNQPQQIFSMDEQLEPVEEQDEQDEVENDSGADDEYDEVENDEEKAMNSSQMFHQQPQMQQQQEQDEDDGAEDFSVLLSQIQQELKVIGSQRDVMLMRRQLQALYKDIQEIKSSI